MAKNSYRYAFASSTSQLPSSGTTLNLGVGEVGIFDASTWQATSAPNAVTNNAIFIAQGTPNVKFPVGAGQGSQTPKTGPITPDSVKKWIAVKAQPAKGEVWTIGFDGADTSKSLVVPTGQSNFTFWLTLSGQPIANLLGETPETHYATYTEQFSVDLPCLDECSDNCGTNYDPNVIADAVIAAFDTRKLIGGQFITDYVKATKLISCTSPSGLPTVGYTTYDLLVQDSGDNIALAQVQAQYPTLIIVRKSYVGITSTYEVTRLTTAGTPAAYNLTLNPLIPNCTTCPSGSTLVATMYIYTVKRKDVGSAGNLATIKTDYSDTAAIRLSYDGVTSVYEVHNTTGITPTAITGDIVANAGSLQNVCTYNTTVTTPWSVVGTCTKATKTFQLTIKNTDCGGTYLAQLQAAYASIGTVALVSTNTGTCTSLYSLVVSSDNQDCDACDDVLYLFTAPTPFQGIVWTEVLGQTGYGTDCVTGIKFESIYEQRIAQECFLKSVPYEYEPLFIVPSTRNPNPNDYSVICATQVPTTKVASVQYAQGFGRVVADSVIDSFFNFNQLWRKNPAERDALSYSLGVNLQGYYDQYTLEFKQPIIEADSVSGFGASQFNEFEWTFFYPQGQGVAFAQAINGWLASANVPIPPVNV